MVGGFPHRVEQLVIFPATIRADGVLVQYYWTACLVVMVPMCAYIADRFALRNIVARKLFHLLVVLMLDPASLFDAPMLSLRAVLKFPGDLPSRGRPKIP
jgi:hypothetical protein